MKERKEISDHNPLELTVTERQAVETIKKNTVFGNSQEIIDAVKEYFREQNFREMFPEEERRIANYNAFAINFGKKQNRIFINTKVLREELIESGIEHEAVEFYFFYHKKRAREVVRAVGLEHFVGKDFENTVAHYGALYFELKRAHELGVLDIEQADTTMYAQRLILDEQRVDKFDEQEYSKIVCIYLMQLAARDIIIDQLK